MITTDLSAATTALDNAQKHKITGEGFLTFGNCLSPTELTAARDGARDRRSGRERRK